MSDFHSSSPDDMIFVMNRLGYGPRAEDFEASLKQGLSGWLDEQLASPLEDEALVKEKLAACKLHIKYDAAEGKWPAVDEDRPLSSWEQPIDVLWPQYFTPDKQINGQERGRPRLETIAATITRAVYSRYQLREVMTQFWHDHFHVNAFSDDHIAAALPTYDRDVIRKNCFGNFRTFLEDVATSTAMQYFLSNKSSRAGAANENYAREMFELHSFGRENYLNDHYDRWRDVPGALTGNPEGYIDQDVYEAARALTGWTVEDGGGIDNGRRLPLTGKFTYVENWHDGYQKRVLATEFDPFGKPMADGRKVLDLVAAHPRVARHLATKLCIRMAGPRPPASLIAKATQAWQQNLNAPDQIARVIRVIALSPEFMQSRGTKIKRPLALMANYVRIMGYDFMASEGLFTQMSNAGQRLFGWPTPTGIPDDNNLFLGSNAMRNRWSLMLGLSQNAWGNGAPDAARALASWGGKGGNSLETIAEWFQLFGVHADEKLVAASTEATGLLPFAQPGNADAKHLALASALAAMSPEFQSC